MNGSYWQCANRGPLEPLTLAKLEEAFQKIRDAPQYRHGSELDPHIMAAHHTHCWCGWERPK